MSFLELTGYECGGADILKAIKFVASLLDIIFIIVPIGLIVMISIDFLKNVIASKEEEMKKNLNLVIKRIVFCVALFLVSPIVEFTVSLLGDLGVDYASCINIALKDDLNQYEIEYPEIDYGDNEVNLGGSGAGYEVVDRQEDTTTTDDDNDTTSNNSISGTYDIKNKKNLVAIMYSTWFDKILPSNPQIISQTSSLTTNKYYFWGEPAVGFYKSSDKTIIKKHMQQLASAGIDFIIIDNTNMNPNNGYKQGTSDWQGYVTNPMTALLDTIVEMRKNGQETPYVVNWIYTGNNASNGNVPFVTWESVNAIYDEFYQNEKYEDVWVYWNDKPFIITTSTPTSSAQREITTRSMWGLNGVSYVNWSYLENNNDKPARDANGNIEQIGVSTAMQATYMSNTTTATGRKDGYTFYRQWTIAFKYHPKVVTIAWWNEWGAINLGNGQFTDLYNQEYSRDIEPMKDGHKDTYYQWMKKYIEAYKNNETCPKLTGD